MKFRKILECFLFLPPYKINKEKLRRKLHGKNILITGASKGIGASLAYLLADSGANLFLVARSIERLEAIKIALSGKNVNVFIYSCDLMNKEGRSLLIEELKKINGGIEIFVSNAGKSIRRSFFNSIDRFHDFERTMSLNFFAPAQLILGLYPQIEKNQGTIVNVSSLAALIFPPAKWAAYQSSKVAFDQWFRSNGAEMRIHKVKTISIYFPLVRTSMISPTKKYRNNPALSSKQAAMIILNAVFYDKRNYKPWWTIFAQISSVFFARYLERYTTKL